MKISITHNGTFIQISGVKSIKKARKEIKKLLDYLPESQVVEEESNPIGFTVGATLERAPVPEFVWEEDEWEEKSVG